VSSVMARAHGGGGAPARKVFGVLGGYRGRFPRRSASGEATELTTGSREWEKRRAYRHRSLTCGPPEVSFSLWWQWNLEGSGGAGPTERGVV
jgi:hypothetical protein